MSAKLVSSELTDSERLAFELERLWTALGNLLEHGAMGNFHRGQQPLRVPRRLLDSARHLRGDLRALAIEAGPHLGVCRSPVIDVAPTPATRRRTRAPRAGLKSKGSA